MSRFIARPFIFNVCQLDQTTVHACANVGFFFFVQEKAGFVLPSSYMIVFLGQVFMCSQMKFQVGQNT